MPEIKPEHKKYIDQLTDSERDSIYRYLWMEHVKNDVKSHIESEGLTVPPNIYDTVVNSVARSFVYEGEYDCNLSYWENLNILVYSALVDTPSSE